MDIRKTAASILGAGILVAIAFGASAQVYRAAATTFGGTGAGFAHAPAGSTWRFVAEADFDGDGIGDGLWRNLATGEVKITMGGGLLIGDNVFYREPNFAWRIVGTPDMDGDGRSDILWWNAGTGQVYGMLMNGPRIAAQGTAYTEPDTAWRVVAVGDFAGTGVDNQVLWRNSRTGRVYMMDLTFAAGRFRSAGAFVYNEPNTLWEVLGAADFDGDGKSDILYRHATTGAVWMLLMNGRAIKASSQAMQEPRLAWDIVGLNDYDRDGRADLLWRNEATGELSLVLMNGFATAARLPVQQRTADVDKVIGPIAEPSW